MSSDVGINEPHRRIASEYRLRHLRGPFADSIVGDFADLQEAIQAAKAELCPMTAVYVYDDQGMVRFHDYEPSEI